MILKFFFEFLEEPPNRTYTEQLTANIEEWSHTFDVIFLKKKNARKYIYFETVSMYTINNVHYDL